MPGKRTNKIRLVGGPFGGKVINHSGLGDVVIRDRRKMSRKAYYEWMREHDDKIRYAAANNSFPFSIGEPMTEARYRACPHPDYSALLAKHPDGSIFYAYIEGTRRDLS